MNLLAAQTAEATEPPGSAAALPAQRAAGTEPEALNPRLVIRGENPSEDKTQGEHSFDANPKAAFIDWLNFSFVHEVDSISCFAKLDQRFIAAFGFGLRTDRLRGHLNYTQSWEIGESLGIFAWGGDSVAGTCFFSISGKGCERVKDWQAVHKLLGELKANITRIDLTHDDFYGVRDLKFALECKDSGGFMPTRGRPPTYRLIEDFDSGTGKTLYVGQRENGKVLRVYEKGKQQGDPNSPWVRWELELHNTSRVIPHDTLTVPGTYLSSSYPCMAWVSETQNRIETTSRALTINFDAMKRSCRNSYGKLLSFMSIDLQIPAEEIIKELSRPGIPGRLDYSALPEGEA